MRKRQELSLSHHPCIPIPWAALGWYSVGAQWMVVDGQEQMLPPRPSGAASAQNPVPGDAGAQPHCSPLRLLILDTSEAFQVQSQPYTSCAALPSLSVPSRGPLSTRVN